MDPAKSPKTDPRVKSSTNSGSTGKPQGTEQSGKAPEGPKQPLKNTLDIPRLHHSPEGMDRASLHDADEEGTMPAGTNTGQATRGSYSTDPATGAGRYGDHSSGQFSVDPLGQPGSDTTGPLDPKI